MKKLNRPGLPIFLVLLLLIAGCNQLESTPLTGGLDESNPSQAESTNLATPYAQEPAAGICAAFDGLLVQVTLLPGIPDPRCTTVRSDQLLAITNQTGSPVEVLLGQFAFSLDHEASYTIETPFGDYLAPGVHAIQVDPCCGAELWLK
jgi:hypothetical protein